MNRNDTSFDENIPNNIPKSSISKVLLSVQTSNQTSTHNEAIRYLDALRKLELKGKEEMATTTILKLISGLYSELLKKKERGGLFFFGCLYDYIFTRMGGSKGFTESKILQLIRSCLAYINIPKIRLFMRLLTIQAEDAMVGELAIYLEMMESIDDSKSSSLPGLAISMCTQESSFVSLSRGLDYVNNFFAKRSDLTAYLNKEGLMAELRKLKSFDPVQIRRTVIDFDSAAEVILNSNKIGFERKYKNLFAAVDVDSHRSIPFEIFFFAVKGLQTSGKSKNELKQLFDESAENYDEDLRCKIVDFAKFVVLCEKLGITSSAIARLSEGFSLKKIEFLESNWEVKGDALKLSLLKAKRYDVYSRRLMRTLEHHFNKLACLDHEVVFMRYRLLEEEGKIFEQKNSILFLGK